MSTTQERIDAAVKLGVEHVKTMPIPPAMAQECARRYLIDEARDHERAATRAVEEAAQRSRVEGEARAWAHRRASFTAAQHAALDALDEGVADWQVRRCGRDPVEVLNRLTADDAELETRFAREREAANAELSTAIRNGVDALIEERAAALDIEWTAALLTATVALPDGTRVLWGEATVEQHRARLDMLSAHAATELATAARHKAAIDAIDATPGAHCLNDLAAEAAA